MYVALLCFTLLLLYYYLDLVQAFQHSATATLLKPCRSCHPQIPLLFLWAFFSASASHLQALHLQSRREGLSPHLSVLFHASKCPSQQPSSFDVFAQSPKPNYQSRKNKRKNSRIFQIPTKAFSIRKPHKKGNFQSIKKFCLLLYQCYKGLHKCLGLDAPTTTILLTNFVQ